MLETVTVPFEHSQYDRQLHRVVAAVGPNRQRLRILTAHLDSGTEEGPIRLVQVHQIAAEIDGAALFAGDTNLRTTEWEFAKERLTHVTDAWEQLGSAPELRRTWRTGARGARFDRVWLGPLCTAVSMTAIGTQSLPGLGTPPSDHVGLLTEFTITSTLEVS
jgi:endonuclease/exonuclease/phosphatase (EEP) superfamily protein YafD